MRKAKPTNSGPIPIIVGPTGVGKSEVAYHLALRLKAEIISADAFQVYKGTEVGTAQPPQEWRKKIPHHLIGARNPMDSWNAVEFAKEAGKIIHELQLKNRRFIVVGGAGFYLRALVQGAPSGTAPPPEIRSMVAEKTREMGNERAHAWLKERDPPAAKRLHPNDSQRICRALEKTYAPNEKKSGIKPLGVKRVKFFGLERSRINLDNLLRDRAKAMWEKGLLNEAEKLLKLGLQESHPLWGAIGYAEASSFSRGETTQDEALERIFRRTRQYAKRQWTWFRHQHDVEWINLDDFSDILQVVDSLEKKIVR